VYNGQDGLVVVRKGMGSALDGNVITFRGNKVRIDKDVFDPWYTHPNANGKSNMQLMRDGNAPFGHDGKRVILHHVDQTMVGQIRVMSGTLHNQNRSTLHHNTGQLPSQIDRTQFRSYRQAFWREMARYLDGIDK
jgi:hypothetical protein